VAREVLDLEVLDRCLVADYTRIEDGLCGTISETIKNDDGDIIGVKLDAPLIITEDMVMTIRSIDVSGEGQNVEVLALETDNYGGEFELIGNLDGIDYNLIDNEYNRISGFQNGRNVSSSSVYFATAIPSETNMIRGAGFYTVDEQEFYHSGDIYMVGTAEILSMVISKIDEVSGDDFTSKITCRLY
jgi:hypothetical protein